jgi:hypothetical protein
VIFILNAEIKRVYYKLGAILVTVISNISTNYRANYTESYTTDLQAV